MEEGIYTFKEKWITQFVKEQEQFIKQECIQHLKETNKQVRIFKIDEDKLNYIFNLGLQEYMKNMRESS